MSGSPAGPAGNPPSSAGQHNGAAQSPGGPGPFAPSPHGWQLAAGLGMPGAAPPPPPEDWQPAKPTSGKAVASLVCGLAGLAVGFFCQILYLAIPVGLVLGVLGILETGRAGRRSGRGLAIAGVILSCLAACGAVAATVILLRLGNRAQEDYQEMQSRELDREVDLIVSRLQAYHKANGTLGPGGPFLAAPVNLSQNVPEPVGNAASSTPAPNQSGVRDGRIVTALRLDHLVRENEVSAAGDLSNYRLTVTGDASARLTIHDWSNRVLREIEIVDAATGRWYRRDS